MRAHSAYASVCVHCSTPTSSSALQRSCACVCALVRACLLSPQRKGTLWGTACARLISAPRIPRLIHPPSLRGMMAIVLSHYHIRAHASARVDPPMVRMRACLGIIVSCVRVCVRVCLERARGIRTRVYPKRLKAHLASIISDILVISKSSHMGVPCACVCVCASLMRVRASHMRGIPRSVPRLLR